jgi:hypothetical protein
MNPKVGAGRRLDRDAACSHWPPTVEFESGREEDRIKHTRAHTTSFAKLDGYRVSRGEAWPGAVDRLFDDQARPSDE